MDQPVDTGAGQEEAQEEEQDPDGFEYDQHEAAHNDPAGDPARPVGLSVDVKGRRARGPSLRNGWVCRHNRRLP